ncbi:MAG: DUF4339 domain-containing protein [Planctomycetes bacterium]|nr:DUF4339 domain-containing protein [Planctomycetota bacterium]
MSANWFIRQQGKDFGPFTDEQLRQLAGQGKIAPADQVFNSARQQWMQAVQVAGLFNSSPVIPTASFPTAPQFPTAMPAQSNFGNFGSTVSTYRSPPQKKSGFPVVGIVAGIVIVGIVGTGVFLVLKNEKSPTVAQSDKPSSPDRKTAPSPMPASVAPAPVVAASVVPAPVVPAPAAATPAITIRKELFDKAHRAAIEFRESVGPKPLDTEIRLIEHSVKGAQEQEVLKMFQFVYEIQVARTQLSGTKLAVAQAISTLGELKALVARADAPIDLTKAPPAMVLEAARLKARRQQNDALVQELEIIALIDKAGGLPVSSTGAMPTLADATAMLVKKSLISPTEYQGIKMISYDNANKSLLAQEQTLLKTISEKINSGGN